MHILLRNIVLTFFGILLASQALATQAGWRQIQLPGLVPGAAPIPVALYYPTQASARAVAMGPFTPRIAIHAPPDPVFKGLIVLSHGTGGSELGHSSLAESLAIHGYLVAALRHPGDNWQSRSLLQTSAAQYFAERPQQVSRVIDGLLAMPEWADRIGKDSKGPRVGVLGHSAGGATALTLVGGQPDIARLTAHCQTNGAADPVFCSLGARGNPSAVADASTPVWVDSRVRAAVVMAPVGVVFSAASLAAVRVPVAIYEAQLDHFLVPRFHAQWIAQHVQRSTLHQVPLAGHFAFMDTPGMAIPSEDGDVGANPPGFDRAAFLNQLAQELPAFFDAALR